MASTIAFSLVVVTLSKMTKSMALKLTFLWLVFQKMPQHFLLLVTYFPTDTINFFTLQVLKVYHLWLLDTL